MRHANEISLRTLGLEQKNFKVGSEYSAVRFVCVQLTVVLSLLTFLKPSGHYMHRTVVTICTVQWSLYAPHSGHCMYRQFNIQQFYILPTQCICVFCTDLRTNSDYCPIQH